MTSIRYPFLRPSELVRRPNNGSNKDLRESQMRRLRWALCMEIFDVGYTATRTAQIARRAHVSVRTLYEHFAGKEELLLDAYRASREFSCQVLDERLSARTSWPDRFLALLQTPVDTVAGAYDLHLGLYLGASTSGPQGLTELALLQEKFALLVVDEVNNARRIDPGLARVASAMDEKLGSFVAGAYAMLIVKSMRDEITPDEVVSVSARLTTSVLGVSAHALRALEADDPARTGLEELVTVIRRG